MSNEPPEYVELDVVDGVAVITVNRQPVNAMNWQMYRELRSVFRSFGEREDVKVALLRSGCDRAYFAGADIKARLAQPDGPQGTTDEALDSQRLARDFFWSIYECSVPIIAAVNGPALGAGFAVVSCCDIVVASETATFGLPEINVGLLGGSAFVARLVGPALTRYGVFTGEPFTAKRLYDLGAIAEVVPPDRLDSRARELAIELASKSAVALRLGKEAFFRSEHLPLKEAYWIENDYTTRVRSFPESKAAMRAFVERSSSRSTTEVVESV